MLRLNENKGIKSDEKDDWKVQNVQHDIQDSIENKFSEKDSWYGCYSFYSSLFPAGNRK